MAKKWSELTPVQRRTFTWLGVVQVVLAAAAWADLSMRPREFVRGRKLWWALVIAVNFAGPISYFLWGRGLLTRSLLKAKWSTSE